MVIPLNLIQVSACGKQLKNRIERIEVKVMNGGDQKAKDLFVKYNGSHFYMDREEEGKLYRSYGISADQENVWRDEMLNTIVSRMENSRAPAYEYIKACKLVEQCKVVTMFHSLYTCLDTRYKSQDSISTIYMLNAFFDMVTFLSKRGMSKEIKADNCVDLADQILEYLSALVSNDTFITTDAYGVGMFVEKEIIEDQLARDKANWNNIKGGLR